MDHRDGTRAGGSVFIHEKAIVESGASIGDGTRVWAFSHVLPGVVIGQDCNLCEHVFIESDVIIGNRVTIKGGISIWSGVRVDDLVFLGPNVVFTNDIAPRSKRYKRSPGRTHIRRGASVGANATILPNLVIGEWAMVGAGSVVITDVPAFGLVVGNPARIIGYVCVCSERLTLPEAGGDITCRCGRKYLWTGALLEPLEAWDADW